MRDNQKSALYSSEQMLRKVMDRASEFPTYEVYGSKLHVSNDRKFGDLHSVQNYVDRVLGLNWVKSTWPNMVGHKVTVRPRKGQSFAHYEQIGVIAVPELGNRWAMREQVILHELAHHLTKFDARQSHGALFAGTMLKLIGEIISPENALILESIMRDEEVKFTLLD